MDLSLCSKSELIAKIELLQFELDQLKKAITGPRSERYTVLNTDQSSLFPEECSAVEQEVEVEIVTKKVAKKKNSKEPKRQKMPTHLPIEEIIINPEVDVEGMEKIGIYESWKFEVTPPEIKVVKTVRPKYKDQQGTIHIADLNDPFPKTNLGVSFVALMIVRKYIDHLPIYRQMKMWARQNIQISRSVMTDSVARVAIKLKLLYELLKTLSMQSDYLEADESSIPVQTKDKPGSTLKGCMLIKLAPKGKIVIFEYIKTKEKRNILDALHGFAGHLQVDGNVSYEAKGGEDQVTLMHCLVHSRRKFVSALDYQRDKSRYVLDEIKKLYKIEKACKEENLGAEETYQRRQQESVPVLDKLKTYLLEQYQPNLPTNPFQNAVAYMLKRWDGLTEYTNRGDLLPDNNMIESQIRPLALGRKNYMFAGSHRGAFYAAILYTLLGTCKLNGINPYYWLVDVLQRIDSHDVNKLHELLPISGYQFQGK
jgi:transposase